MLLLVLGRRSGGIVRKGILGYRPLVLGLMEVGVYIALVVEKLHLTIIYQYFIQKWHLSGIQPEMKKDRNTGL